MTPASRRAHSTTDITVGCASKGECLCVAEECCLSASTKPFQVGVIKEDPFVFKLGLPCCTCGVKKPSVLCLGAQECLCVRQGMAFPFADPVPGPICAVCCIQCLPNMGVFKPPGGNSKVGPGAPDTASMER